MSGVEGDTVKHKTHRDRNAGRKAEKKKAKKSHIQELTDKQRNPKAFTFNSAIKAERRFRRKQDIETKKQHIPLVDRTPIEPPPILVAIVGPPKVGKSLVIQCLIKSFTRHPLTNITGPVTVVSGKKRRITFMECNNDINSMIDIAKVADLVLLLVDASFGFEMEVFEFLNICQIHGMPRIMGVLTHLDMIKNATLLKKTKKTLKQRFWTEVYAGAKLFYLSGILHNEYLRNEVKNLARFISVMKFRPLTWRTTHSYLLADRIEDLTNPEEIRQNPKVDRTVSLYGYVRGVPMKKDSSVHIPGCGDLQIKDICFLPDPCPLPEQLKKRSLVEKERLVYAPFSGVGGIVYDKDAVYIDLGGSHYHKDDTGLLGALQNPKEMLDEKLERSQLQLFSNSAPIASKDVDENIFGITSESVLKDGRVRRKVIFKDKGQDVESEDEEEIEEIEEIDSDKEEEGHKLKNKQKESLKIDDESSNEDESDEEENEKNESLSSNSRKNSKRKSIESCDDTSDDDVEEREPQVNVKIKKKKKKSAEQPTRNTNSYVKDRIAEALSLISAKSSQSSTSNSKKMSDDEESFDELSEDERENLSIDESDKDSIYEDEEMEEKNRENDDDDDDDDDDTLRWRNNLAEKARDAFLNRRRENVNIEKIVYSVFEKGNLQQEEKRDKSADDSEAVGGIFHLVKKQQQQKLEEREVKDQEDNSFFSTEPTLDWLVMENKALLVNRFVTGKWKESEDAEELLKLNDLDDQDLYGDFEDLETGEKFEAKTNEKAPKEVDDEEKEKMNKLLEKKLKLKKQFEAEYDENDKSYYDDLKKEAEKQSQLNKSEFEGLDDEVRVQLEGFRPGMYVRVEFDSVPYELVENLDPSYPLIVGGLLPGEQNVGYVQVRVKKHRWYPKILKSRNPLIVSVGWRRFQTIPIYSKLEDNLRNRMLKYTPEHVACMSHFWGPITPQSTGVLAVQDVASRESGFRIAATGTVVETNKTTTVVKKLKLTGAPLKIYKKTAFIKDMFNTALEVAKFEGVRIKTVSGIRGQIKKAVSKPEGCFRGTFEDKIQLSDIVFCRTWYKIDIPKFYNPVTSLLLPPSEKNQWRGMKTVGQLKREQNIKAPANVDSIYQPVERQEKFFKPLFIPKNLQKELPYRDKPKMLPELKKRKLSVEDKRVAVVREPREENIAKLMNMIKTTYEHKREKQQEATHKRIAAHKKKVEAEEMKRLKRHKELKKQVFRTLSKMEAKNKKG
ncbi:ribosome biogenesis protein BMS1 homolog isoform X2 [Leptopilina heterotoma]|uniref:ribosome biogenesis protein BMS1 homolog isoform X2 n=1 Tax=Leptopilina heterotoma TaxID=63436 RepID=UPI001CA8D324|nr:ribosome biogenesis protein BMS1 homolog isoform X2 [Leptopilina heterotoma]